MGSFLPGKAIDNSQIEEVLGFVNGNNSKAKNIVLRSNGIKSRHYALDPITRKSTHTNAELTALAVKDALKNTEFEDQGVELLACGTTCPDQFLPSHAIMVHGELEGKPHEVVSTAGVCCSSLAALKYGYLALLAGDKENAVVTGSEISSKFMRAENFENERSESLEELKKNSSFQFEQDFLRWMLSDGAGAFLLEKTPKKEGVSFKIDWIDFTSYANEVPTCMYGGAKKDENKKLKGWLDHDRSELLEEKVLNISQDTKLLDQHMAFYAINKALVSVKKKRDLKPGDIDWFVPHYSSDYFRKKLEAKLEEIDFNIPTDKWFTTIESKGNIGSASIYIYLQDLLETGKLKNDDTILCFIPESSRFSVAYMQLTVVVN
ncbi:hypothetical protein A9Q84_05500 [Halobacteriovorax marinus]|uniref:Beta-ketoacyl-[acyl-carrier-protein] synthase III C-terminal domain-containing protein n=1 Tax=Halobacteriovorax marinus TaxID=97084 RepID=A0A1Y5FBJ1_9BACT|nr:hypothetical protein A9Q84_05500 [Halobacteriovorax marinus]